MLFAPDTPMYAHEIKREAGEDVLYINFLRAPFVPSIADYPEVMELVLDCLMKNPNASRIVLVQQKNYNYDFKETALLIEIAQLYNYLLEQEQILSQGKLTLSSSQFFSRRYNSMFSFLLLLRKDPVAAFTELRNLIIEEKILLEKLSGGARADQEKYLFLLEKIYGMLSATKMMKMAAPFLEILAGDREIYNKILKPDTIPNFTFTRLVSDIPQGEVVGQYKVAQESYDESLVTILRKEGDSKLFYHIVPPENSLGEDQNFLLNLAKGVLMEHQPKAEEFTDTGRTRQVFFNIAKDLLQDLAKSQGYGLSYGDVNKLATILVRHTIGFGVIEVLLQDQNLQDISLNAPISMNSIFVKHQEHGECSTNILPSQEDANSWAAKFRMISGRPLDEANPVLDTQLEYGKVRARVSIIQEPLSPNGIAYAFRRHREDPWTLPLFVKNKMLNPFAAGLLSFLVDGARTLLIAGTRSSGKTSLLGSLMLEIIPKYRIIVVEDSLELPVDYLRKVNYDILRMKVRSALMKGGNEVSAEEGIRTSLRLGDSCLIVGEVRSVEATALYEAMRVGALANVVAGTIHGASPYAVFDRVVNDLDIPATSFKATDIIAVANPVKSADGLSSWRRLIQVSEVRKHWKKDPQEEKGFVDLLNYDVEKDDLKVSEDLINGESQVIKDIAAGVKGWAGNWDAVYDNILLRAKIKKELVDASLRIKNSEILEADFNILSNDAFHRISKEVKDEIGLPLSERVFPEWQKWLNQQIKGKRL